MGPINIKVVLKNRTNIGKFKSYQIPRVGESLNLEEFDEIVIVKKVIHNIRTVYRNRVPSHKGNSEVILIVDLDN